MCGITGFWNLKYVDIDNLVILKKMASTIAHRGPDDEGYFIDESGIALAHKRLSIIDLSKAGHQPMLSSDERYVLVYNGEIYNYLEIANELKKQGVKFRGNSDSEVLLEAFKFYGDNCVTHFNGMFSFVIWDNLENKLFVARDRIGIKPFYYHLSKELFVFGSEIKAITAHPSIKKLPNSEAIYNYLNFSHQLDEQTWFKDIYQLEPGHTLTITKDTVKRNKYWQATPEINYSRSYNSFKEELVWRIEEAIVLHQRSDVAVGAHLSGGIDSSAIVSIASKIHQGEFHTFSSAFSGFGSMFDENREINEVRKFCSNTIHHQVSADPFKAIEILPSLIAMLDEPTAGPAIIPMYFVNELISKNNIRVVNGGQGVDELFGGYPPSYTLAAHNLLSLSKMGTSVPFSELLMIPLYYNRGGSFNRLFRNSIPSQLPKFNNSSVAKEALERYLAVEKKLGNDVLSFERNMLMSLKHYLPALLHQEDRMSMNWSLESRVPFLDHRLVELSMAIPSFYKVKHGILKSIFREALREKVPNLILDNKVKRGYPTPISSWSKNEMAGFFNQTLKKDDSPINEFLNIDNIQTMLREHISGKIDYTTTLWSALCTKIWFNEHFK
jgi:asparagine synthase (glutamine-hydrolysing)